MRSHSLGFDRRAVEGIDRIVEAHCLETRWIDTIDRWSV
jgi:hypothetical protein